MGFFTNIFKKSVRAEGEIRDSRSLAEAFGWLFGYGDSTSGIHVSPEIAMSISTAFACGTVLEEDVSKLPFKLHKKSVNGKEPATDHSLYSILHDSPNEWMDSFTFRSLMMNWCIWRGNGYAYINRAGGIVKELLPIHPDYVTPKLSRDYALTYEIRDDSGNARTLGKSDVFHLMRHTINGYTGVSVITYARETIGTAIAAQKHGAMTFKNGAKMSGIIEHPTRLKDKEAVTRLRDSFDGFVNGENTGKTAVLEDGAKYNKVSMSNEDAQYLESRKFEAEEICRWFRVPQHKVQILDHATFSNIEHQSLEYVSDTLLPWLCRWEHAVRNRLLTTEERAEYIPELVVEGVLRGDIQSRYNAYAKGINWGFLSPNEARAKENLNSREGGDVYFMPLNMEASNKPKQDGDSDERATD
jgi:HK97 family phage portal protein